MIALFFTTSIQYLSVHATLKLKFRPKIWSTSKQFQLTARVVWAWQTKYLTGTVLRFAPVRPTKERKLPPWRDFRVTFVFRSRDVERDMPGFSYREVF